MRCSGLMRSFFRAFLPTSLALLAAAMPAAAATPPSGTVSTASPQTAWAGTAHGYVVRNGVELTGLCEAPTCDTFVLTVADAGALTVTAQATGADENFSPGGFVYLEVVKPDGDYVLDGGEAGNPETSITIGNAEPGAYTVKVATNQDVSEPGTYAGSATLGGGGGGGFSGPAPGRLAGDGEGGLKDATVIAVIDNGINPYHWDFLASRLPQHLNADPGDDLPLSQPAAEWLPGFDAGQFASTTRLDLSIEEHRAETSTDDQRAADQAVWESVQPSLDDTRHLVWMPGTKVIGALTYNADRALLGANDAHGVGVTSASVGNLHGTCPECLLFFINHGTNAQSEKAIEWAMSQPWIDVITNSYGFHAVGHSNFRPNVYSASNTDEQLAATARGQTIFFSAGNGVENGFVTPNMTTYSSQKGPDWIVTVGAVTPGEDGHYETIGDEFTEEQYGPFLGAGKPVDLAGVGSDYPTAYWAETVSGTGTLGFGGTSNATPVVAGMYGRALYMVRTRLKGASKIQSDGVVARGKSLKKQPLAKQGSQLCGGARPDCELADGELTSAELRTRLFHGTLQSLAGLGVGGQGTDNPTLPKIGEEMLLSEGHGVYRGRVAGNAVWQAEQDRILDPLFGTAGTLQRPAGEREWFVVDSFCRQRNWGSWAGGYYVAGATSLPADEPTRPVRASWAKTCPGGRVPPAAGSPPQP